MARPETSGEHGESSGNRPVFPAGTPGHVPLCTCSPQAFTHSLGTHTLGYQPRWGDGVEATERADSAWLWLVGCVALSTDERHRTSPESDFPPQAHSPL